MNIEAVQTGQRTTPRDAPDRSGPGGGWTVAIFEGHTRAEARAWEKLRHKVFASEAEANEAIAAALRGAR